MKEIIVIGGGLAGTEAALQLAKRKIIRTKIKKCDFLDSEKKRIRKSPEIFLLNMHP